MKTVVEVKNVSYAYQEQPVLQNIQLHVRQNEIVSILGSSGVGKTTLFHLIAGIYPLQTGQIAIHDSQDYIGKVSYMLQKDLLLEHKRVIDNVMLPLLIQKYSKTTARQEAMQALENFGLADYAEAYPKTLSGGMRQRVSLLRTYLFKQDVFLLDEAFSALDALTKLELHNWYLTVRAKLGLTTILITHDIDEAIYMSDRIYILKNKPGEIVAEIAITLDEKQDKDMQRLAYKKQILAILLAE